MRGYRVWSIKDQYYISTDFCGVLQNGKVFNIQSGHVFNFQDNFIVEFETGLTDKNGVKIFEGDRIKYENKEESGIATIEHFCNCFCAMWKEQKTPSPSLFTAFVYMGCSAEIEVIGNIHDQKGGD